MIPFLVFGASWAALPVNVNETGEASAAFLEKPVPVEKLYEAEFVDELYDTESMDESEPPWDPEEALPDPEFSRKLEEHDLKGSQEQEIKVSIPGETVRSPET
jgi:hypothetical protein